jgi:hypothetical protein
MAYAPNISRIEDDGSETPMTLSAKACEWKCDGDGGYYVKCGDFRVKTPRQPDFDEDGTAHNFAYCPYCGGRLTVAANAGGEGRGASPRTSPPPCSALGSTKGEAK